MGRILDFNIAKANKLYKERAKLKRQLALLLTLNNVPLRQKAIVRKNEELSRVQDEIDLLDDL